MTATTLAGVPLAPFAERTINAVFLAATARFAQLPALGTATPAARVSYHELEMRVARIAALLQARGTGEGDRVAILSENRPEWAMTDHAVLSLGAVTVPIYPSLPASQVAEILDDSEPRIVFVSGPAQAAKVAEALAGRTGAPAVISFDTAPSGPHGEAHDSLHGLLASTPAPDLEAWRSRARAVRPEALATLIYTSGTTGTPKGVMLTHANLAAMVAATHQHASLQIAPGDVALSILPLSHVFERAADYYLLGQGTTIVYAESMQTVPRDLLHVRPHHVITVPRLLEKVYDAVTGSRGLKGTIARWAAATASEYAHAVTHGETPRAALRFRRALADRLVYRVIRRRVGGRLRTFICGGAPLDPRVGSLFHSAGLPVYEGYGLTETSPVIAANRPGATRLGSAGVPYPGVEVRLGEEQEIQVRGPGVTRGYWNKPEASAAVFTGDGWFRTGDIGAFEDGFLRVVDRLKDLIVTAGGKNVAPQPIEARVVASPLVAQAVLLGDRRPYLVMLVVPEKTAQGHDDQARLAAEIASCVQQAAVFERPKRIAILDREFSVDNGLLTPTLKVRRRAVQTAYASLLDDLYAGKAGLSIP